MSLSEKRIEYDDTMDYYYPEEDVKEFIKELKSDIGDEFPINSKLRKHAMNLFIKINKLAGDKLIETKADYIVEGKKIRISNRLRQLLRKLKLVANFSFFMEMK